MKCIGASYVKHLYFQIVGSLLHLVDAIAGMACNVDPRHISVSPLSSLFGQGFPCKCNDRWIRWEILKSQQPTQPQRKKLMPRLAASGRLNNLNIFTYLHMSAGLTGTPVLNTTSKEQMPSRENGTVGPVSCQAEWKATLMICCWDMVTTVLHCPFAKEDMYYK